MWIFMIYIISTNLIKVISFAEYVLKLLKLSLSKMLRTAFIIVGIGLILVIGVALMA